MRSLNLLKFILISTFTLIANQPIAIANHNYLFSTTFEMNQKHHIPVTRDTYEGSLSSVSFQHTHTLRLAQIHTKHPSGEHILRDTQKIHPESSSLNTLEFNILSPQKPEISLRVWMDSLGYSIEKKFEVEFIEGNHHSSLTSQNFSAQLTSIQQELFNQMMKDRFIIEVASRLEKKRLELHRKDLYVKKYEFKNFHAQGRTTVIGNSTGLILIHPSYSYEISLTLTRIPTQSVPFPLNKIALPADFIPIEEIDLNS